MEVLSTIEILYNQINLVEFVHKYLDFGLENLDNNTIIKFILYNNKFIKSKYFLYLLRCRYCLKID